MTFRKFAFNNVVRNKRLYAAYFFSSLFTVMVFFTFAIFSFHPSLSGDAMNSSVNQGMLVSAGIIYVFSFFFVLYSMSFFLQSRKKEFGVLMIQGMSMKQIRKMVFLENMLIGLFATLGGIFLGFIFSKGILLLAEYVLIIENSLYFYFPSQAMVLTFVSFVILFFFISLFVSYVLRSKKLIELIKGDKRSKGEPRANLFIAIVTVILLAVGYGVALMVEGLTVLAVMTPVIIVVIIGTYFLFTQVSVYVINKLRKQESIFWFKTNMILFSDLSFRMKDNARTFFLVAIVSTVAFSAIGTLFGFQAFVTSSAKINNPTTFKYAASIAHEYDEKEVELINKTLHDNNIKANEEQTILRYHPIANDRILIANESEFNRFAKLIGEESIDVPDGQMYVVEYEGVSFGQTDELLKETVELSSGVTLKPNDVIYSQALPATDSYYVVSDHDYDILPNTTDEEYFHAWQATDGEERVLEVAKTLNESMAWNKFSSREFQVYDVKRSYGPIMFVGLFIGIVFFVSAGSFLYFRLYMDVDDDKHKFKSIAKMGLSEKEMRKVITRQTAILFFAPIVVALAHGAVALTALSHMFYYNLFTESVSVLSVFFTIQIMYFFIVRFYYTKQIKTVVQ